MAARTSGKSKPKRTTKKKKKTEPLLNQVGAFLMRYEVIGITLILISVLTLLSLITQSPGSLTGAWLDALYRFVGIGTWGVPFFTGALGLWLVIFAIDNFENLAWQRPVGLALILLAVISGSSLAQISRTDLTPSQFDSNGGLVGNLIATSLRNTIGIGGAWAIITLMVICGIAIFADRFLARYGALLWWHIQDWRSVRQEDAVFGAAPGEPFQPQNYPFSSSKEPIWRRLFQMGSQRGAGAGIDPPILVNGDAQPLANAQPHQQQSTPVNRPLDGQKHPAERGRQSSSSKNENNDQKPATQKQAQTPASASATSPKQQEPLPAARIIGDSTTEWQPLRLPKLNQVLQSWDRVVDNDDFIRLQGAKIQETLALFGVPVSFEGVNQGPTVTQYLIRPGYEERIVKGELKRTKVKVSKIAGLGNDLALALAAASVRIEAPVPGTSYVGVEVPNQTTNTVGLRELMESEAFEDKNGKLKIALGEDVKGNAIVADMARMPHLLIAGATGAGKSVCINSIITCLLCTHTPESLRMLMIDPKMVELSVYNRVPHLLSPVVTEVDKASAVLYWAVKEMERRYQLCSKANARDLERYNQHLTQRGEKPLPYILVIVDEMADLMMAAPEEVEKYICRLAQMARAVGIHMIIATQRPSVDVITGLIKANFPSRIAFAVSSSTDSRVILDSPGAERLLGKGDMLYMGSDGSKLSRMQGTYLSDDEINDVVRYWKGVRVMDDRPNRELAAEPLGEIVKNDRSADEVSSGISNGNGHSQQTERSVAGSSGSDQRRARTHDRRQSQATGKASSGKSTAPMKRVVSPSASTPLDLNAVPPEDGVGRASYGAPEEQKSLFDEVKEMKAQDARDTLFDEAVEIIQQEGRGSTSLLQRKLRIGYNRASRLIDQLEAAGIVGPDQGKSKGRAILIGRDIRSQDDSFQYDAQLLSAQPASTDEYTNPPRIIGGDDATPNTLNSNQSPDDDSDVRVWM